MKQMTCAQMGGPCEEMISGNTAEEMVANGMKHMESAHPEMAAKVKAMSKEETDKWMEEFKGKWEAAPDMQ